MEQFEQEIAQHNQNIKDSIFKSFEGSSQLEDVSKGITVDQFTDEYGQGHEVFTKGNIDSFKKDISKKMEGEKEEDIQKAIDNEISSLNPVIVNNGEGKRGVLYVRKQTV